MPARSSLKKFSAAEVSSGLKIARAYRLRLKVDFAFNRPWREDVPLESQSVFTHFVAAGRAAEELGASPREYVEAQFRGLAWTGKPPYPHQLVTANARLRFEERRVKLEDREARKVKAEDYQLDGFDLEMITLKRLKKTTGLRTKDVLKLFPSKFTPDFRRYLRERKMNRVKR